MQRKVSFGYGNSKNSLINMERFVGPELPMFEEDFSDNYK